MKKIIFFTFLTSHSRCLKRIESITKLNINYEVHGFNFHLYENNAKQANLEINHIKGRPFNNKLLDNVYRFYKLFKVILNSQKDDYFYIFGINVAIPFFPFINKRSFFYEEADIDYASRNKILFNVFKFIEDRLRKKSLITIFTSEGYVKYFYDNIIPENVFIQRNKLHPTLRYANRNPKYFTKVDKLTFGFIGRIRFETIFNFAEIVGKYFPNHQFYFYGNSYNVEKVKDLTRRYNNILYFGEFSNPIDLENIYLSLDILVVTYDTKNFNTHYAEPNKLFEAIYFCKPIVVSESTFVGDTVIKEKIGFTVNPHNEKSIVNLINSLEPNILNEIISVQLNYKIEKLFYDDSLLIEKIKSSLQLDTD